jgi:hypothetical protein
MHSRLLSVAVAVAVLVTGVASAACSSDKSRGSVKPEKWADKVCTALAPWRTEISALTTRAQQEMDAAKNATQARAGLVTLLDGAAASSERARARVAAAGVPDAANGRRVATEFTESLRRTRDAYGRAKDTVAGLPTTVAKTFYDRVSAAFEQLDQDYRAGSVNLTAVDSKELQRAFDTVPACR